MSEILNFLTGGIVRLVPEVIGMIDKQRERKHELAMLEQQASLAKVQGEEQRALAAVQGTNSFNAGVLQAWEASIKAQAQQTGVKWVDGINALVRPGVTIIFLFAYIVAKVALGEHDINQIWTEADSGMLFTILGFWFVNRSLPRK